MFNFSTIWGHLLELKNKMLNFGREATIVSYLTYLCIFYDTGNQMHEN